MTTPTKRQYPRVPNIKDTDIKESLKLSWNKLYDLVDQVNDLSLRLAAAEATITQLTDRLQKAERNVTQALIKSAQ